MSRIGGDVEDFSQGHLSIAKVRGKRLLCPESLPLGRGDDLALDQFFDRENLSLPIDLLRLKNTIQSFP